MNLPWILLASAALAILPGLFVGGGIIHKIAQLIDSDRGIFIVIWGCVISFLLFFFIITLIVYFVNL